MFCKNDQIVIGIFELADSFQSGSHWLNRYYGNLIFETCVCKVLLYTDRAKKQFIQAANTRQTLIEKILHKRERLKGTNI